nr:uncharacterized protein LOC123772305 [Procambarus clarkii]XP_045621350.1 uncharacterized protein LOC123772305 [Procambarus clarkii]XP_045621351.1 uncharacterized protein LOC123772305 [Procambarus clarkii]
MEILVPDTKNVVTIVAALTTGAPITGALTTGAATTGAPTTGAPTIGAPITGAPTTGASTTTSTSSRARLHHRTGMDVWDISVCILAFLTVVLMFAWFLARPCLEGVERCVDQVPRRFREVLTELADTTPVLSS